MRFRLNGLSLTPAGGSLLRKCRGSSTTWSLLTGELRQGVVTLPVRALGPSHVEAYTASAGPYLAGDRAGLGSSFVAAPPGLVEAPARVPQLSHGSS